MLFKPLLFTCQNNLPAHENSSGIKNVVFEWAFIDEKHCFIIISFIRIIISVSLTLYQVL